MTGEKRTGHRWTPSEYHDHDDNPVIRFEDGTYGCHRLPAPWFCSREPAHTGPCAATRDSKVSLKATLIDIKEHTDVQPAYYLSKEQREVAKEWIKKHNAERHILPGEKYRYAGACGGAFTWCFTSTSLGVVSVLECACGERIDVSDYDW